MGTSKKEVAQKIFGIGNKTFNIMNEIGNETVTTHLDILKDIFKQFEEVDKHINNASGGAISNKTKHPEEYETEKIINSLIRSGIPLIPAYEITRIATNKIQAFLISADFDTLTTRDIRKMVHSSIEELEVDTYQLNNIEVWATKYARRYGNHNQCVEIYHANTEKIQEISYKYIKDEFIDDIAADLHIENCLDNVGSNFRTDIADEIVEFINHCDLYRVNYDALKSIIIEIATQPPHPWFVTEDTKKVLLEHDRQYLEINMSKIITDVKEMRRVSSASLIEVLHHAASLILQRYHYFLGCYDLSSLRLLQDVIKNIQDPEKWDLTAENLDISNLLSDLVFSGIDVNEFVATVNSISKIKQITPKSIDDITKKVLVFGEYALKIDENGNSGEVKKILGSSDWGNYDVNEIVKKLKFLLYTIYLSRSKVNLEYNSNSFWIYYKDLKTATSNYINDNIMFFFRSDTESFDASKLQKLSNADCKRSCNLIVVIAEHASACETLQKQIRDNLSTSGLDSHYSVAYLDKEKLLSIFESSNRLKCFEEIITQQFTLED